MIKTRKNLDGFGSEIEVLRKELIETIDTLNNSDFVVREEEGREREDIGIEEKLWDKRREDVMYNRRKCVGLEE